MRPFVGSPNGTPQFDFYAHGGGISAGGMALFLTPDFITNATTRVRWDLSDLSASAIAVSTYGEGDFEITGPPDLLLEAYYMVGPLGRYIPPVPASGFRAYWLGQPPFDPRREMEWTYQAYEYLRKFYRDPQQASYRVFIRALPGATGPLGGAAIRNSFMVATNAGPITASAIGPRNTIVHEMGHMWIGSLAGDATGSTTWFSEGLNEHYTRLLLLRSGLAPVQDYDEEINGSAGSYFTSPYRTAPAEAIARIGFSTGMGVGSAQNLPYARGSLYFATVDAKIRAASDGRRTLDDVILPLLDRRRSGERIDQNAFVDALVRTLGPNARYEFESVIIRGEPLDPASGAFGPCFERQRTTYTLNGRQSNGFAWVRNQGMSDAQCRQW
jgi:predicted metalloprotease with PDZ domain